MSILTLPKGSFKTMGKCLVSQRSFDQTIHNVFLHSHAVGKFFQIIFLGIHISETNLYCETKTRMIVLVCYNENT